MSSILKAENVHKSYGAGDGKLHVIKGISFEVAEGKVTGITGPSGAGKSTLLHILGGIDRPDDGSVYIKGQDMYALKDSELARLRSRTVGFVFQFYHLLPELSAAENVMLPGMISGMDRKRLQARAAQLLADVGLGKRGGHKPSELSGGEMQRVAIARAMINEPDIILCDEPTGNLDSKTGMIIIEELVKLNRSRGQTLVIITHDAKLVQTADEVFEIEDGVISAHRADVAGGR